MQIVVDVFAATLQLAIIYGIVNLGFVYLYRTTGVLNLAQGPMLMLGAFIVWTVAVPLGLGVGVGIVVGLVVSAFTGQLLYYGAFRFLSGATELPKVIGTFMLSIIIVQIVGMVWGVQGRTLPMPDLGTLHPFGGSLSVLTVVSAAIIVLLVVVAQLLLSRAGWGLRMRAAAENEPLTAYFGIRRSRLAAAAWSIAFASATLAGVVYAEQTPVISTMFTVGLLAFPAAVIGGLDSVLGALLGAILIAVIQSVAKFYLGGDLADALAFFTVIVTLLLLPHGLLGRARSARL